MGNPILHKKVNVFSGYRISKSKLNDLTIDEFNQQANYSSIKRLAARREQNGISFDSLVRGNDSLGSLLEREDPGSESVPSVTNRSPGTKKYLAGKWWLYDEYRENVDVVQTYVHFTHRELDSSRLAFAAEFASAVADFYHTHYGNTVKPLLIDHIKQDIFWLFRQLVAYCCIKKVHFCATFIQQ